MGNCHEHLGMKIGSTLLITNSKTHHQPDLSRKQKLMGFQGPRLWVMMKSLSDEDIREIITVTQGSGITLSGKRPPGIRGLGVLPW